MPKGVIGRARRGAVTPDENFPRDGSREPAQGERRLGFCLTLATFTAWGLIPVYWKALDWLSPVELLAHRVVWSTFSVGLVITVTKEWPGFFRSFSSGRPRFLTAASGTIIGLNWGLFIWAVNSNRILETSLAYYMNPLINILIGYFFFAERLRRAQVLALLFAGAGVGNLAVTHGQLPWLALAMAVTFSLYAALRKAARVPAVHGLFFETALLCPLALAFLLWDGAARRFMAAGPAGAFLLAASGAVTSAPLAAFAYGVRRLRLVTVGLLQFISPSLSFLLGIFVYGEPFSAARMVTFVLIWVGVAAYSLESLWTAQRYRLSGGGRL